MATTTIPTPHTYAGFWRRFGAACIDTLIFLPLMILTHLSLKHWGNVWLWFAVTLFWGWIQLLYTVYSHGRTGWTLGKLATGIKLVSTDFQPATWWQAVKRSSVDGLWWILTGYCFTLTAITISRTGFGPAGSNPYDTLADAHPPFFVFLNIASQAWFWGEFVTMMTNRRRRAIHDYMAGTVVVQVRGKLGKQHKRSWLALVAGVFLLGFSLYEASRDYFILHRDPATRINEARQLLRASDVKTVSMSDAMRAESILVTGRGLNRLTPEELDLVCRARNEMGDRKGQQKAAEQLWAKATGSENAVLWMRNSVRGAGDSRQMMEFADMCISNHFGNLTEMLVMKAEATLMGGYGTNPSAEAESLLVRAYTITNALADGVQHHVGGYFITPNSIFKRSFSQEQQAAIIKTAEQFRSDAIQDALIYGNYLQHKNTPLPEEVARLVSAFSQAYASFDTMGVTNLFLSPSGDKDGDRRQVFLEEIGARFKEARREPQFTERILFKPLCFDPVNDSVLLDGQQDSSPSVDTRLYELFLTSTNGQWRIMALRQKTTFGASE